MMSTITENIIEIPGPQLREHQAFAWRPISALPSPAT